jgi:dolichol-phosphate mannosyltransferase
VSTVKVTVVVPTREEEGLVGEIVDAVRPYGDEVLVIDGHSKDRTREIAAAHGARVVLDHGKGKGEALRLALEVATGEVVVFIDADGSHEPRDIPAMVAPILAGQSDWWWARGVRRQRRALARLGSSSATRPPS